MEVNLYTALCREITSTQCGDSGPSATRLHTSRVLSHLEIMNYIKVTLTELRWEIKKLLAVQDILSVFSYRTGSNESSVYLKVKSKISRLLLSLVTE